MIDGEELELTYRTILETLARQPGTLGVIFRKAQNRIQDPAKLKRLYGDRLTFFGTVGTPRLWAWGSPADIRAEVRERIATVGEGGGLIIAPAYDLEPAEGIPWANVLAFFEAVDEFGTY